MHSFVFDGDERKDFIRGLGLRFNVAMSDLPHDRHIRFAGEGSGLWAEGVRNLTGLRRHPGQEVIDAQLAGEKCPPVSQFPENVARRLDLIPYWGDYTLTQNSSDAFEIRKRTKAGTRGSPPRTDTALRASASSVARPPGAWRSACAISGNAIRRSSMSAMPTPTPPR